MTCIVSEGGDIKSEWTMFKSSFADAAARRIAVGTYHGSNPSMHWCIPMVWEAIKWKESFQVMLKVDSPHSVEIYW